MIPLLVWPLSLAKDFRYCTVIIPLSGSLSDGAAILKVIPIVSNWLFSKPKATICATLPPHSPKGVGTSFQQVHTA